MDDVKLEKVKAPFVGGVHNMTEERYGKKCWRDAFGIRYKVEDDDTLIITASRESLFIPPTIVDHINYLPAGIKVIINTGCDTSVVGLNILLGCFSTKECNKNVTIDVTEMDFKIDDELDMLDLPDNIKISNTNSMSRKIYLGENSFDWWLLRRSENAFGTIVSKLDHDSKIRALDFQGIAMKFYFTYRDILDSMDDKDKCRFAFKWVKNNTVMVGKREQDKEKLEQADPIQTYRSGKGVCTGRARLFKTLLSNRYFNIDCYLVEGTYGSTPHEWNEVYLEDGARVYYDVNFGVNGLAFLSRNYFDVNHFDYLRNREVNELENSEEKTQGKKKRKTIQTLVRDRNSK